MEFVATCPKGFERLLADELSDLRVPQVRPLKGQVSFGGALTDAYRVCLWSRLASRVLAVLARVDARDSDALYDGASSIAWEGHLVPGATFAVDAHGTNAQLRNTQFVALRVKDAIVDRIFAATGVRPLTGWRRFARTMPPRCSLPGDGAMPSAQETRRSSRSGPARAACWWRRRARRSTAPRACFAPAGALPAGLSMTTPSGRLFSTRRTPAPPRARRTPARCSSLTTVPGLPLRAGRPCALRA